MIDLRLGDCLEILPTLPADSVDAVVTDPPAGIGFMGKAWDSFGGQCNANAQRDRDAANVRLKTDPNRERGTQPFGYSGSALPKRGERDQFVNFLSGVLSECLRIARPGSVLLCWALPRTSHWTGLAIEESGWQIEDRIAHVFGTGFPKHRSKLKPSVEDWWLARKPGPKWLGVDACRIGAGEGRARDGEATAEKRYIDRGSSNFAAKPGIRGGSAEGRWPSNLVLSHGDCQDGACSESCPIRLLGEQSGETSSHDTTGIWNSTRKQRMGGTVYDFGRQSTTADERKPGRADSGTAARYFPCFDHDPFVYTAKASRRDRNEGCEGMPERVRLRNDLTPEQRAYVIRELEAAGVAL